MRITTVFPAPAGINRVRDVDQCRVLCVPRASGDKPSLATLGVFSD